MADREGLVWLLKDMDKCRRALELFQAVLVDMVVQTTCRVVTVARQALVAILPAVRLVTMGVTKLSHIPAIKRLSRLHGLAYVLHDMSLAPHQRLLQNLLKWPNKSCVFRDGTIISSMVLNTLH